MVKTKLFEGYMEDTEETYMERGIEKKKRRWVAVDEEMNRFLEHNPGIEIQDIKFSTAMNNEDSTIIALMIYKEAN